MTGVVLVLGLALGALTAQAQPADAPYEQALEALAKGDAVRAEAKAREALAASLRFAPEEEIEIRPDRGLLFEEMIVEARRSYRARRVRYFRALGDALQAQRKFRAARKSYRRAMALEESPSSLPLLMAGHEDLSFRERLDLLLQGYLLSTPGERSRLESELLETGAFRTLNALKAKLDRIRFGKLEERYSDLDLLDEPFPDFQAVTNAGTLIPSRLFDAGATLVVYSPARGSSCGRCSEELDGLTVPVAEARKKKRLVEVAAFVPESELEIARRIVRLLGMPVGVGRSEGLPPVLSFAEEGEIRVVAHGGLNQIRIPMSREISAIEIRERAAAIFAFLEEPGLPARAEPEEASRPLVTLARAATDSKTFVEWIDRLEKLEAGPAPLTDFHGDLARVTQRLLSEGGRKEGVELLRALSRLRGANVAKTRVLSAVGDRIGEKLLEKAQSLDATVRRTPAGEAGVLHVAVGEGRLYLQRSFESDAGLRHFDFAVVDDGASLEPVWAAPAEGEPLGVEALEAGGAFLFGCPEPGREDCRALKLVDGGEARLVALPGAIVDGKAVELRSALVDAGGHPESGPHFFRSTDSSGESALERGLRLFDEGDFASAAKAFEVAANEIDEREPYDASDLLYNRGRALQELGKRREALEIFRSLGDVPYQHRVDEQARLIESGR